VELGMVGLGRMGGGMAERLRRAGHAVVGYDRDPARSDAASLEDLVRRLAPPRHVWVMLPAGEATERCVEALAGLLAAGDLVVDGGNADFRDSMRRAEALAARGIFFVDAGVSGGVWGLEEGFCLMLGGAEEGIERLRPILDALAPPGGWARVGPSGSGHFVKMVHNGIEYGLMQAYAEGFDLLRSSRFFPGLDPAAVAELWRHGSVIRSWLLDLAARALARDPELQGLRGYVEDSGEGRWTIREAIASDVPVPTIALALFMRFASRREDSYANRLLAALRHEFGGHPVRPA
jgi:6-phosphogluconate dehydrogenase